MCFLPLNYAITKLRKYFSLSLSITCCICLAFKCTFKYLSFIRSLYSKLQKLALAALLYAVVLLNVQCSCPWIFMLLQFRIIIIDDSLHLFLIQKGFICCCWRSLKCPKYINCMLKISLWMSALLMFSSTAMDSQQNHKETLKYKQNLVFPSKDESLQQYLYSLWPSLSFLLKFTWIVSICIG